MITLHELFYAIGVAFIVVLIAFLLAWAVATFFE